MKKPVGNEYSFEPFDHAERNLHGVCLARDLKSTTP